MDLAIDIGNTRIKVGLFKEGQLQHVLHPAKEELSKICEDNHVSRAVLCNVGHREDIALMLPEQCAIFTPSVNSLLPLTIRYDTPQTLGMDRVAAAAGAVKLLGQGPVMIVDAGTCITIDLVDEHNCYWGGAILPGIQMRLEALSHFTQRLPCIQRAQQFSSEPAILGTSTESSILCGTASAAAIEIEEWARRHAARHPQLQVLVTGGDSQWLCQSIAIDALATPLPLIRKEEYLLLEGLETILQLNCN